jgi:hypothetical protein
LADWASHACGVVNLASGDWRISISNNQYPIFNVQGKAGTMGRKSKQPGRRRRGVPTCSNLGGLGERRIFESAPSVDKPEGRLPLFNFIGAVKRLWPS